MRAFSCLPVVCLLVVTPAACGASHPVASPAAIPPAASDSDRSGPRAGVPDLTLPDDAAHRDAREGLKARLSFVRAGDERPDLLQRIALDHLEEAEEADRAAAQVEDWTTATGSYPEAVALRERLLKQATTNRAAAVRVLEDVVREYPRDEHADVALYTLATALAQSGRTDEAITLERQLVADHPESTLVPDARLDLGDAAYESNDVTAAKEQYEAIRSVPGAAVRPFATYKLAWVETNLGAHERALSLFLEVASTRLASPDDPLAGLRREALRDYARLYAIGGATGTADVLAHFERIAGDDAPALLALLAQAYADGGKPGDAGSLWAALLERTAPCDAVALDFLRGRMEAAAMLGLQDMAVAEAVAWNARYRALAECSPPEKAGQLYSRRRDGVDAVRGLLRGLRRDLATAEPGRREAVQRLEAIVEGLDPEDPVPGADRGPRIIER